MLTVVVPLYWQQVEISMLVTLACEQDQQHLSELCLFFSNSTVLEVNYAIQVMT